jgi:hypothetical protein
MPNTVRQDVMSKIAKFIAALGFVVATAGVAQATPAAAPLNHDSTLVTQAAFGCGPGFRPVGPFHRCVPIHREPMVAVPARPRVVVREPACPSGMHLNSWGRCKPNF